MVFQQFNLFERRTALDNVKEGLVVVKKLSDEEATKIAKEELAKVGRDSNFHTADCNMITHLITDHTADPETIAYLKSIGVKVLFIS